MFDKHGSRRNRHNNRLKFLLNKIGLEKFIQLFHKEFDLIKNDSSLDLVISPLKQQANKHGITSVSRADPSFHLWQNRYVLEQKQTGLFSVLIPLRLGDLHAKDGIALASFLERIGENSLRCSREQNIRLRNIPLDLLGNVFTLISSLKTMSGLSILSGNIINCNGTLACKAGICQSGGLSGALVDEFSKSKLELDNLNEFKINISGCPNACSMHHIADLGFAGRVGRKNRQPYPAYRVFAGARRGEIGKTCYGEHIADLPAKSVPKFTSELLASYLKVKDNNQSFSEYLKKEGQFEVKRLVTLYQEIPTFEENTDYYFDFGSPAKYSLEHMGKEECSASMFDMIEVDKRNIKKNQKELQTSDDKKNKQELVYNILFHACRMLLVTKGIQIKEDKQAFINFKEQFIQNGLISKKYDKLISLGEANSGSKLLARENEVVELAEKVIKLYERMSDSLKFKDEEQKETKTTDDIEVKDLRGIACPINFVHTKVALSRIGAGDKLFVYLDDGKPIQNVPSSVKLEGHVILESKRVDNFWSVLIEKH